MRRLPLRAALPLAVSLLMLVVIGIGLWSTWQTSLTRLDIRAQAVLRDELYRLARHAGGHGDDRPVELWQDISQAAAHTLVREVALIDHRGQVQLAHRRSWTGQPAARVIGNWDTQRLAASLEQRQVDIRWDAQTLRLSGLLSYPRRVFDPQAARQLEPAVVYVQLDLRRAREDLALAALYGRLPDLLAIGALLALLALWLHLDVARPLAALQRASRDWAGGDLQTRAAESGPAEIARLAQAFNHMVTALQTSQNELRASKEQLSTILYSTGDALLATDVQQCVTLLNPAAERLTGWREHEARGRPVAEVFRIQHALTGESAEIPVQRVIEHGLVVGLANHTVLISRQGLRTHIADSAAPVRDGTGAIQGVVLVFRDVNRAYELEQALAESEAHYRALANAGHALIWTTDLQGRGVWCNEPWLAYTGQRRDDALSADWLAAVHPDDLEDALLGWRQAVESDQPYQQVLRLRRHDGSWRAMLFESVPRHDAAGLRLGHVLLAVDVTHEREADSRMQSQLDELRRWQAAVIGREERVAELKAEVNTLLGQQGQSPRYAATGTTPAGPGSADHTVGPTP